jgi:hypothetical protein
MPIIIYDRNMLIVQAASKNEKKFYQSSPNTASHSEQILACFTTFNNLNIRISSKTFTEKHNYNQI